MDENQCKKAIITLLEKRADDTTICPSEVARSLAQTIRSPEWRGLMSVVHTAVDDLITEGVVQITWKGKPLDQRVGTYLIRWRPDKG